MPKIALKTVEEISEQNPPRNQPECYTPVRATTPGGGAAKEFALSDTRRESCQPLTGDFEKAGHGTKLCAKRLPKTLVVSMKQAARVRQSARNKKSSKGLERPSRARRRNKFHGLLGSSWAVCWTIGPWTAPRKPEARAKDPAVRPSQEMRTTGPAARTQETQTTGPFFEKPGLQQEFPLKVAGQRAHSN